MMLGLKCLGKTDIGLAYSLTTWALARGRFAENLSAEEALAAGFLSEIVEAGGLDRRVGGLCARLAAHAPITMRGSKAAVSPPLPAGLPGREHLVRACYGSDDFRLGVEAFVDKREPRWTGK